MSKKALGKGLEALFQVSANDKAPVHTDSDKKNTALTGLGQFVDIEKVIANPEQPRKEFDEASLKDLADSIKQKGVLQPILVEKKEDKYQIIAGERRYRAASLAGLKEVPVIEKELSEEGKLEIALIENIQREDLSPIDEAKAFSTLIKNYNIGQDELSKRVGKNRSTIANSLRLLKMPQDMQDAISSGEISSGHARAILSVVNPADQRVLFNRITTGTISVREAEKQAANLNNGMRAAQDGKKHDTKKRKSPDIVEIEQKFIDIFGTKVNLNGSIAKGKIEISYFSKDDLERIFDIIAKN
ncbi:MAG: ParB/RepB/Spo0J family partition protein [Spirochaetaceae bacterium]|nr:ParB/RepB/Spo0J family partition protein [Spirochaetaceae bacterium]